MLHPTLNDDQGVLLRFHEAFHCARSKTGIGLGLYDRICGQHNSLGVKVMNKKKHCYQSMNISKKEFLF